MVDGLQLEDCVLPLQRSRQQVNKKLKKEQKDSSSFFISMLSAFFNDLLQFQFSNKNVQERHSSALL
jgi:hypothetical protein